MIKLIVLVLMYVRGVFSSNQWLKILVENEDCLGGCQVLCRRCFFSRPGEFEHPKV